MAPVLGPLAADPGRACLLTDFDGTLAPIVDDPLGARPLPGAVEALRALTAKLARVAVVSGRPASYLYAQVGDDLILSGLYGLELVQPGTGGLIEVFDGADAWRAVIDQVVVDARAMEGEGVVVEPKGLSVTLHTRTAQDAAAAVRAFAQRTATATGLVVHPAKQSIELRPPVTADKGTVVRQLTEGMAVVGYLGDDVGDLPAFAALDVRRAEGIEVVKVAVGGPELDRQVAAAADVIVESPAACLRLIVELVGLL